MKLEGGCYCGQVRYKAEGDPMMKAQCHCRECQYISGGSPNMFVLMPLDGFSYTKGAPKKFKRSDLEHAVTREFCAECGTHLVTRPQGLPALVLKVGTLTIPIFSAARSWRSTPSTSNPSIKFRRACRPSSGCRHDNATASPPGPNVEHVAVFGAEIVDPAQRRIRVRRLALRDRSQPVRP